MSRHIPSTARSTQRDANRVRGLSEPPPPCWGCGKVPRVTKTFSTDPPRRLYDTASHNACKDRIAKNIADTAHAHRLQGVRCDCAACRISRAALTMELDSPAHADAMTMIARRG